MVPATCSLLSGLPYVRREHRRWQLRGRTAAAAPAVCQPEAKLSPGNGPAGLRSQAEASPFIKRHLHKSSGKHEAMTAQSGISREQIVPVES